MDDSEVGVLLLSLGVAGIGWGQWYVRLARVTRLGGGRAVRCLGALAPAVCSLIILAALRLAAAHDVRGDSTYLALYLVLGLAWLRLGTWIFPALGISLVDDLLDRRNPSAAMAVVGAWIGLTACYIGGNIGDGPGWWCVGYSAGLASLLWLGLWLVAQRLGDFAERITVDRDPGSGIRLAGLLAALGLVCGRGAAGDWVSFAATQRDLVAACWPALPLTTLAGIYERWLSRTSAWSGETPPPPTRIPAVAAALLYLALAIGIMTQAGPLSENPLYGSATAPP